MLIQTRDFGEIDLNEEDVITFKRPIYGFDELSRFVILYDDEISDRFVWMQSVEEPDICFVMIDPSIVRPDYQPTIPEKITELLGEGDCICWSIINIREKFEESTANLKSPILVNPLHKSAVQLILDDDYPIRQRIMPAGEGEALC